MMGNMNGGVALTIETDRENFLLNGAGPTPFCFQSMREVDAVACLVYFNAEKFDPGHFARFSLACPPAIKKSVGKRQAEYLAGRLCARYALTAFAVEGEVATGAHRNPLWPDGFLGSITHSGNLAAAVVARAQTCTGIGIDVESIRPLGADANVAMLIVQPDELKVLDVHQGRRSRDFMLTLVFSAKESFFKAAFPQVGKYFDFDAVSVQCVDWAQGILKFVVNHTLSAVLTPGKQFHVSFKVCDPLTIMTMCLLTGQQGAHPAGSGLLT